MENLVYALVQLVHNFGAVAVTAGPLAAVWPERASPAARATLLRLVVVAWIAQIASGVSFGATSLHYYGALPELSTVARAALVVKVLCALLGLVLSARLLRRGARAAGTPRETAWPALAGLGATALAAAAVLRWFS